MIFVQPVTIPANTPATAPLVTTMNLAAGRITLMAIQFPSGVNALAHVQVWRGLHQLFPTNQDGDFATGAETIVWDEDETIDQPPLSLTIYAWNADTVYSHTITVRAAMSPLAAPPDLAQQVALLLAPGTPA